MYKRQVYTQGVKTIEELLILVTQSSQFVNKDYERRGNRPQQQQYSTQNPIHHKSPQFETKEEDIRKENWKEYKQPYEKSNPTANKGAYIHPFTSKKHVKPYNVNVQNINTNNNHNNKNNYENKIVQQLSLIHI